MQEQHSKYLLKIQALFFQVGIKSVTMDHVATHLGISKKTLYQWVSNKNELVQLLIESLIAKDEADCKLATSKSATAIDEMMQIKQYIMIDLEMMKANVIFDIRNFYPEAWDLMQAHQKNFCYDTITTNLVRGISEGYYRADLNIELVARLHGHQVFNLFDEQWFPSNQFAARTVVAEFMTGFVFSITNTKGRAYLEQNW
jgi:AcrR family transcriptional regulator